MTSRGRRSLTPTSVVRERERSGRHTRGEAGPDRARTPSNDRHQPRRTYSHDHPKYREEDIPAPKPRRLRKLSSTETFYPSPEAAQNAFAAERAGRAPHRRPSTPYTRRADSSDSLRSRVSFDSIGSHNRRENSTAMGPGEPHFGSSRGIGPAGEAIEVIGLGRKEPRHRKFAAGMLKPALRSGSRREDLLSAMGARDSRSRRVNQTRNEKPLPSRPVTYLSPVVNSLFRSNSSRHTNEHVGASHNTLSRPSHSRSRSQPTILGSLFSSLALNPSPAGSFRQAQPSDDLFTYLRIAECPAWTDWPSTGRDERRGIFGSRAKGFESMGREWGRRLQAAEAGRMEGRALRGWEAAGRRWEERIHDCEWRDLGE